MVSARSRTVIMRLGVMLMAWRDRITVTEIIVARFPYATSNALELREEDAHHDDNDELRTNHARSFFRS
jgi:hypothetical protein